MRTSVGRVGSRPDRSSCSRSASTEDNPFGMAASASIRTSAGREGSRPTAWSDPLTIAISSFGAGVARSTPSASDAAAASDFDTVSSSTVTHDEGKTLRRPRAADIASSADVRAAADRGLLTASASIFCSAAFSANWPIIARSSAPPPPVAADPVSRFSKKPVSALPQSWRCDAIQKAVSLRTGSVDSRSGTTAEAWSAPPSI